jgi:antitoxin VapB
MNDYAKVFWSGRSQAVRLPKEYRFDDSEVRIRREGRRVILEPADIGLDQDIAEAAADEIDRLRAMIEEGLGGGDEAWDVEEIKRAGRAALKTED